LTNSPLPRPLLSDLHHRQTDTDSTGNSSCRIGNSLQLYAENALHMITTTTTTFNVMSEYSGQVLARGVAAACTRRGFKWKGIECSAMWGERNGVGILKSFLLT
jgi:hypothetical protein